LQASNDVNLNPWFWFVGRADEPGSTARRVAEPSLENQVRGFLERTVPFLDLELFW
jgi:hypothetical protein